MRPAKAVHLTFANICAIMTVLGLVPRQSILRQEILMNKQTRHDVREIMIRSIAILGLSICGILIGIALALLVAQVLGQSCAEDRACQSGLYGLIGGITLTQGVNLIVMVALVGYLRRRKNKRARMTEPEVFAINDGEGHSGKRPEV